MSLSNHLSKVIELHHIEPSQEIIVRAKNGNLCYIPIARLVEVLSSLYKNQQELIEKKLLKVENSANEVMNLFYILSKPLANIKL